MKASTVASVFALCALASPALASPLEERAVSVKTKTVTATINHTTTKTKTKTETQVETETIVKNHTTTKTVTKPAVTNTRAITVTSTPKAVTQTTVSTLTIPALKASTVTIGTTVIRPTTVTSTSTKVLSSVSTVIQTQVAKYTTVTQMQGANPTTITNLATTTVYASAVQPIPETITQVQTVTACSSASSSGSSVLGSSSAISPSSLGSSMSAASSITSSNSTMISTSSTSSTTLAAPVSTATALASGYIRVTNSNRDGLDGQCGFVDAMQDTPFAFTGDTNDTTVPQLFEWTSDHTLRSGNYVLGAYFVFGSAPTGSGFAVNLAGLTNDQLSDAYYYHPMYCSMDDDVLDCALQSTFLIQGIAQYTSQNGLYTTYWIDGRFSDSFPVLSFVSDISECSNAGSAVSST